MKFLQKNRQAAEQAKMIAQVRDSFEQNATTMLDKDFSKIAYSTEANKSVDYDTAVDRATKINEVLEKAGLRSYLENQANLSTLEGEQRTAAQNMVDRAMETAVATAVALGDADNYHSQYLNAKPQTETGVEVIEGHMSGQASALSYAAEGYDNFKFENFREASIVTNALSVMTNSFEDVWFKPVLISPSEQGADVSFRIPRVLNDQKRATDGTAYDTSKMQKLVIDAYRDRSILANTGNKVYPNVDKIAAADIAAAADVPNITKTLNGTEVQTRPLKFNKNVDILGASAHAGLPGSDNQNQTDTLSPTGRLGIVYVKVTVGASTGVVAIDTAALNGSLFVPSTVGNTQELLLNLDTRAQFSNNTLTAAGGVASSIAGLGTEIGNATDTEDFKVQLHFELAGSLWPRDGNIKVNLSGDTPVKIVNAFDKTGNAVDAATLADVQANVAVELIGYLPELSRTNSNLRDKGQMVDLGSEIKYRMAVPLLSPISSVGPISVEGGNMGMEGLQMINRARKNGIAVQTLFDYEKVIEACSGQKTDHAGVGSQLITPTYVHEQVTLKDRTVILRSAGAREDVREAIGAAMDQVASDLIEKSGYEATLDTMFSTTSGYEFIIVTSPRIHSLLMTSGDARLLGANRRFTIVSNHDTDFIDRIYISVRRPGETNVDPLSFAAHVSVPPLVYETPVHVSDASHSKMTQLVPRELYVGTCPILGRIDVVGLNSLFTDV